MASRPSQPSGMEVALTQAFGNIRAQEETMSITVVSTLNKPSQVSPAEGTPGRAAQDDPTADTQGFAGLLLAQFRQLAPQAPVTPESLATSDTNLEPTDGGDNSALLAALGLVAPTHNPVTETRDATAVTPTLPGVGTIDRASANSTSTSANTSRADNAGLLPADDDLPGKVETNLAGKPAADDKPAIIAAASSRPTPVSDVSTSRNGAVEMVTTTPPAPVSRDAPLSITTPVKDAAWTSDFADKIVWLATNDKQSAKLTLNPAHMGPLEISLNIDKGHATASFVSANADVRDALETALPRLREMFANAGISLGQTNVSAESSQQQTEGNPGNGGKARWSSDNAILVADSAAVMPLGTFIQRGNGTVDIFA